MLIRVDLAKEDFTVRKLKQNTNEKLEFEVYENGIPFLLSNKTIQIHCLNQSGNVLIQTDKIIKNENKLTVDLMKDMTAIANDLKLQVHLEEAGKETKSFILNFIIKPSVVKMGNIIDGITTDIIDSLTNKITEATKVKDDTENLIATGGAVTKAELNTVSSRLDENILNISTVVPVRYVGEVDDTLALQRAIDAKKTVYINRHLTISATINIYPQTIIEGNGKSDNSNKITMTNDSKFLFSYLTSEQSSPYDITVGITFKNLNVKAKNFLTINSKTLEFAKIGHIKGVKIDCCKITGASITTNQYIATPPTYEEIESYGVGIRFVKTFDFSIRDSEIQRFGIAVDLLGSDIGLIDNCRFGYNHRHYHSKRISTYGSQCKIKNCDMMWNLRYGGVYLDKTRFDSICDNYFECYQDSATFISDNGTIGLLVDSNRFDDNNRPTIPMAIFEPEYQLKFINNRFNQGSTPSFVKILPTNANNLKLTDFAFVNNTSRLKIEKCPLVVDGYVDNSYYNINNIPKIEGQIANSYPFEYINGEWKLKKITGSTIIHLKPQIKSKILRFFIETKETDETQKFHMNIFKNRYGGELIYQGVVGKVTHTFNFPAKDLSDCEVVVFEFISNNVDLIGIKVVNDYSSEITLNKI